MRMSLIAMILLLVAAMAMPFFFFGPQGGPLLSWRKLLPDFTSIPQSLSGVVTTVTGAVGRPANLYKWQDAKGTWHFSDQPPANNQPFQTMPQSSPDLKVMPNSKPTQAQDNPPTSAPNRSVPSLPFLTADPGKVLEEATKLHKIVEQRNATMERLSSP